MAKSPRFERLVSQAKKQIREVSPQTAHILLADGAVLIDVRESQEFSRGHVPRAINLSRGVLELRIEEVVAQMDTAILCYCGGGGRSALAAESLQKMGYTTVASVSGGFRAWKEAGLPLEVSVPTSAP